jgi:preprotein translocase subunit SecG
MNVEMMIQQVLSCFCPPLSGGSNQRNAVATTTNRLTTWLTAWFRTVFFNLLLHLGVTVAHLRECPFRHSSSMKNNAVSIPSRSYSSSPSFA